jgi:hypothetical protein
MSLQKELIARRGCSYKHLVRTEPFFMRPGFAAGPRLSVFEVTASVLRSSGSVTARRERSDQITTNGAPARNRFHTPLRNVLLGAALQTESNEN